MPAFAAWSLQEPMVLLAPEGPASPRAQLRKTDIGRSPTENDDLYIVRPYYLVPDGKAGHHANAVIRGTIKAADKVALARVVLTNCDHIIAVEARDNALWGCLLRYIRGPTGC